MIWPHPLRPLTVPLLLLLCAAFCQDLGVPETRDLPRPGRMKFQEFVEDMKIAIDAKPLKIRPIEFVFGEGSFLLDCQGLWAEFGVFTGKTLTLAADWRMQRCGPNAPPVYGFDTFTGLPENWKKSSSADDNVRDLGAGFFSLNGQLPTVPANARLVRGLFSETLPGFLADMQKNASLAMAARHAFRLRVHHRRLYDDADAHPGGSVKASYLHIDCDLYAGARDTLMYLSPLIQSGTVLVFDELINYPTYAEHEIKALWEWLVSTGLHVRVIGGFGPLQGQAHTMEMRPAAEHGGGHMGVALVVV